MNASLRLWRFAAAVWLLGVTACDEGIIAARNSGLAAKPRSSSPVEAPTDSAAVSDGAAADASADADGAGWTEERFDGTAAEKPVRYSSQTPSGKNHTSFEVDGDQLVVTNHYASGEREKESTYRDGVRHGPTTEWWINGRQRSITPYRDGKKDGLFTSWRADGTIREQGYYRQDRRHGLWTFFSSNGKPRSSGQFVNDRQTGTWTIYGGSGEIIGRRQL